jgi:fatty-acyl-CoA synthase
MNASAAANQSLATCLDLVDAVASVDPDGDVIVLPQERESYSGFAAGMREWARVFIALRVAPGAHVGVLLPNGTQFMHVLFGAMMAGAVPVPINTRFRGAEIAALAARADLVAIVTVAESEHQLSLIERLYEALPDLKRGAAVGSKLHGAPLLRHIIVASGSAPAGMLDRGAIDPGAVSEAALASRRRALEPESIALVLFTSGSTAEPKGCLLSHRALIKQGRLLAERYRMTRLDRLWSPLPMFHVGGISPLLAMLSVGGAFLSMRRFEAACALDMLERERVSIAYPLFQAIIADLLQHPSFGARDLRAIRLMVSNFALQPPWIRELLTGHLPHCPQIGTYGLTESIACACTHEPTDAAADRLERLGRPLGGIDVRIVGEDGRALPAGEIGEILLRGPTLFSGYYRDAAASATALRGGWLHTGDRGSLDAAGSIMFHGRIKDVLKVGGENVGALEIETVFGAHPAVRTCAAVGVPDPRLVEVPVVFAELRAGHQASEEELIQFCRDKLASFKVPRGVFFVTEWPMSATKIDKPALRRAATAARA